MLIPISNTPRDYSWGSTDLIARLQGREPTGSPEAEIWYGDHPGDPSDVVGAGGGSLPLLQKSGIAESKGLGGFPIGGQWLVCDNPEIVDRHRAKVYGQALATAPTMAE